MTELMLARSTDADNAYHVYLSQLADGDSRRTMRGCLDRMASLMAKRPASGAEVAWHAMRYGQLVALRELIAAQGWSPDHANKHLHALHRVLKESWKLGQMSGDAYQRARTLQPFKGSRVPTGRHLPDAEVDAALDACAADTTHLGRRDAAMIGVLDCGLRRAELCALRVRDFDLAGRTLLVRGKGDRHRLVPVPMYVAELLAAWLDVRGRAEGALFVALGPYRTMTARTAVNRHMTGQAVADVVKARMPTGARCHDFRRTVAGRLLSATDPATAADVLGHASITTTVKYDRRPEERMREAVDRISRRKEIA